MQGTSQKKKGGNIFDRCKLKRPRT